MDQLDPRLVKAIEDGDLTLLQMLLTEACNFDEVGVHLISHAVLYADVGILRWLLGQGADPNLADLFEDGHQALYWAIFEKRPLNWDIVKALVEGGATVLGGEPPDDGATALHLAAEEGDLELTRYLLDYADGRQALDYFDQFDDTPLHKAVKSNSVEVARLLLQTGADVNALVHIEPIPRIGDTPIGRQGGNDQPPDESRSRPGPARLDVGQREKRPGQEQLPNSRRARTASTRTTLRTDGRLRASSATRNPTD